MKTNTPNPLVPQGTFPDQRGKAHIRIAVFTILAVHMVLFVALLMAGGCKKPAEQAGEPTNVFTPSLDSNLASYTPPVTSPPPVVTPDTALTSTSSSAVPSGPVHLTPTTRTGELPPLPAAEREHTVVKGDSFYKLARTYGVSMKAIAEVNPGVDSAKLKLGQKLKIPPATAPATSTPTVPAEGAEKIHVVKSQENLTTIAKAEGVSVKALIAANNLKTTRIKVGQKLKIPSKAPAPTAPEPFTPAGTSPVTPPATVLPTTPAPGMP